MPTISQIIGFRNRRRSRTLRKPGYRVGVIFSLIFCVLVIISSLALAWYYTEITRDLPSLEALPALLEPPTGSLLQPTQLFDRSHTHVILTLEDPAAQGKRYLQVSKSGLMTENQFSPYLVDAIISIYEPGFWENPGYSISGWTSGAHPTIAQWLVVELTLNQEPISIKRNLRERLLAAQITQEYGREKILEWYLNSAPFGALINGADAAARVYFNKSATSLSLGEAALLTAISETPDITPSEVNQILKQRQEAVIQAMAQQGMITSIEAAHAMVAPIQILERQPSPAIAPAFTRLVLQQLSQEMPMQRLMRGGYEIVTTLDYDLQLQAECAVRSLVSRSLGGELIPGADTVGCEMAQLLPPLPPDNTPLVQGVTAELAILDTHSGQIIALVGEGGAGIDPTIPAKHTGGTILAPFLYLTAFSQGMSPGSLVWDIPDEVGLDFEVSGQEISTGVDMLSFHGPVRARVALVNDYMAASQAVLMEARPENVRLTLQRFGFGSIEAAEGQEVTLEEFYSNKSSLMDIVSAYGVLANQGWMAGQPAGNVAGDDVQGEITSTSILSVSDKDGNLWLDWTSPHSKPIVSPPLAYLATDTLSDASALDSEHGQFNLLELGRPAAVKTGFSQDSQNAWVVGYTADVAAGVWIGIDAANFGEIPLQLPASLWQAAMGYVTRNMPVSDFQVPEGLTSLDVCDPSGMLVNDICPKIVEEIYLAGNQPTQVDNLFEQLMVNRETGLLATVFTPTDMVEPKVFMDIPPEAVEWAKAIGLPIQPTEYDKISTPSTTNPEVKITVPTTFDHVGGVVEITGSATGADFSYYRLHVGQGLNPQEWLQVGKDEKQPVEDGLLGFWDTEGMEGPYVIQLVVVREDLRVQQAMHVVTIDNTPPHVEIITPREGENIIYTQNEPIMMQANATDNLVIQKYEFYVDGLLETSLVQPPFVILWTPRLGEHTLMVRAYDLAGNQTETSVSYLVELK